MNINPSADPKPEGAEPTIPVQPAAKKPINSIRIAMYALIALAGHWPVDEYHSSRIARRDPHTEECPDTEAYNAGARYSANSKQQEREQVKKLQEENAAAAQALAQATRAAQGLQGQLPSMMPCTAAIAGTPVLARTAYQSFVEQMASGIRRRKQRHSLDDISPTPRSVRPRCSARFLTRRSGTIGQATPSRRSQFQQRRY